MARTNWLGHHMAEVLDIDLVNQAFSLVDEPLWKQHNWLCHEGHDCCDGQGDCFASQERVDAWDAVTDAIDENRREWAQSPEAQEQMRDYC